VVFKPSFLIQQAGQGPGGFCLKRPFAAYVTRNSHRRLRGGEKKRGRYHWGAINKENTLPQSMEELPAPQQEPRRTAAQFNVDTFVTPALFLNFAWQNAEECSLNYLTSNIGSRLTSIGKEDCRQPLRIATQIKYQEPRYLMPTAAWMLL
jgi:hypothetical protein